MRVACSGCFQRRGSIIRLTTFSSTNVWLRSSQSHATRSHRPKCLDATISNRDIPVVDIDGRVAMAGNELKLLVQPQHIMRVVDYTMFVGTLDVLDVGPPIDDGHAAVDALGLQTCVADGLVRLGLAHDRRVDEEAVFELRDEFAVAVLYPLIVRVHEDIRSALQFVVDAARAFHLEGTGAGSRDDVAIQPLGLE